MKKKTIYFFYLSIFLMVLGFQFSEGYSFSLDQLSSEVEKSDYFITSKDEVNDFYFQTLELKKDQDLFAEIAEEETWRESLEVSTNKDQHLSTLAFHKSKVYLPAYYHHDLTVEDHASILASSLPPIYLRYEVFRLWWLLVRITHVLKSLK